ncbi:MAG: hypothetical protein FD143_2467 [Ignavibacteria bacterium]|nr:MAG: hypothetical protein FD143_2467 [Ignavibacteria bacterium]KAF0157274.1 MAG: hypothetical protein FD188_2792 [Ignavibacteria bacterium]
MLNLPLLTNESLLNSLLLGFFIAFAIVFLSYRVKFLTFSGSVATFFLAGTIFSLGGVKWSVPILTFFILTSILSKLRKKKNAEIELFFEKSSVRDHFQVLANGGISGVLVVLNFFFPDEIFYLLYLSSLSAVCADTWATEIGTWKRTVTYNILNLKPIEQGVSGGISLVGTFGSFVGALIITFSGVYWNSLPLTQYFLLIIFTGMLGSIFDSFLGATVQSQNKCNVCRKVVEREIHCGKEADYHSGWKWINNDMVNFISGAASAAVLIILVNILN